MPQYAAGIRMLPPVSVPSAPSTAPVATELPEPELEPPAHRDRSHGFFGIGNGLVGSGIPIANSMVVVLPMTMPPALRNRVTTTASPSLQAGSRIRLWAVDGASAVV